MADYVVIGRRRSISRVLGFVVITGEHQLCQLLLCLGYRRCVSEK